jgi:hypothetical protein
MNQVVTLGAALVLIIATGSSAAAQTGRMLVMQADASEPVVPALRQPAHLVVEEVPISTALTNAVRAVGSAGDVQPEPSTRGSPGQLRL